MGKRLTALILHSKWGDELRWAPITGDELRSASIGANWTAPLPPPPSGRVRGEWFEEAVLHRREGRTVWVILRRWESNGVGGFVLRMAHPWRITLLETPSPAPPSGPGGLDKSERLGYNGGEKTK